MSDPYFWVSDEVKILRAENEQLREDLAVAVGNPCALCQAENERQREALDAADALANAVLSWRSHVTLEGLVGTYRKMRNA